MTSKRSVHEQAHREALDVAFWMRPEQPTRPAQRVGEILHAVASAVRGTPFGDLHGVEIRPIDDLTLEGDASLEASIEVRARAARQRASDAGRQPLVVHCRLTYQFTDGVAGLTAETEANADEPAARKGRDSAAAPDPDRECIDNIPV